MSARSEPVQVEQLRAALEQLGLDTDLRASTRAGRGWDAIGSVAGVDVVVEVKANPTVGDVLRLAERDSSGAYKVLVGLHLWAPVREAAVAHGIGYFDARGHLRLWAGPLMVDTAVAVDGQPSVEGSRWRLDSPSALDIALAVLDGTAVTGVRATAAVTGRAPGTVSKQLAALRSRHLVDDAGEPLVPALFEAVVEVWQPARVPLAALPEAVGTATAARLGVRFDDLESPGWVLADSAAAAAWGAPLVMAGDAPPDFYAPDAAAVAQARALFGEATYTERACTVAAAPCPYVCRHRVDRSTTGQLRIAPSLVVAALDLARDPARGREILEQWSDDLPAEVSRVW